MNCHANKCIECTVQQCAYHCENENYCSLDRILVGTHETNPTVEECTDCKSFRKKYAYRGSALLPRFLLTNPCVTDMILEKYANIQISFLSCTHFFHMWHI